jgi:hypothetical protein
LRVLLKKKICYRRVCFCFPKKNGYNFFNHRCTCHDP